LASVCGENLRQKSLKTGAIPPNGRTEMDLVAEDGRVKI